MLRLEKRCHVETAVIAIMRISESIHVFLLWWRLSLANSLRPYHFTIYLLLSMCYVSASVCVRVCVWVRWVLFNTALCSCICLRLMLEIGIVRLLYALSLFHFYFTATVTFRCRMHCKVAWNYFDWKLSTPCHAKVGIRLPQRARIDFRTSHAQDNTHTHERACTHERLTAISFAPNRVVHRGTPTCTSTILILTKYLAQISTYR